MLWLPRHSAAAFPVSVFPCSCAVLCSLAVALAPFRFYPVATMLLLSFNPYCCHLSRCRAGCCRSIFLQPGCSLWLHSSRRKAGLPSFRYSPARASTRASSLRRLRSTVFFLMPHDRAYSNFTLAAPGCTGQDRVCPASPYQIQSQSHLKVSCGSSSLSQADDSSTADSTQACHETRLSFTIETTTKSSRVSRGVF